jgi:hypothetical protein
MDQAQESRILEPLLHPRAAEALVLAASPKVDRRIVAVVLADGSMRELEPSERPSRSRKRWSTGSLSGRDWVMWWQRRTIPQVQP